MVYLENPTKQPLRDSAEKTQQSKRKKVVRTVVKHPPLEDPTALFEAQWKAMLAPKEKKKRAKKAAAPEEEVTPVEAAAEEAITDVKTATEAPAPEAEEAVMKTSPADVAE